MSICMHASQRAERAVTEQGEPRGELRGASEQHRRAAAKHRYDEKYVYNAHVIGGGSVTPRVHSHVDKERPER